MKMKVKILLALVLSTVINYILSKVLLTYTNVNFEVLSVVRSVTGLVIAYALTMFVYKREDKKNPPTT